MKDKQWVLALDLGTSSVTAAGYDLTGQLCPHLTASRRHTPTVSALGSCELDADQLLTSVLRLLRSLLDKAADYPPPQAVGFSCFWHSFLGVDRDFKAVTPLWLWADTRSWSQADQLRARLAEEAYRARTGCPFHATYFPARLQWLRYHQSPRHKSTAYWVCFADYLYAHLFSHLCTSYSMAAGSGLFHLNGLRWDEEILEHLELTPQQLPRLVDAQDPCRGLQSDYRSFLPELASVPWYPAVGDGACSNIGAGCADERHSALMIGTSGALRCILRQDRLITPPGLWCYRLDSRRFVLGGAVSNGGNLHAWLRETLRLPPLASLESQIADQPPAGHGLVILPFWAGERSPGWASHATGSIAGFRSNTTPVQIMRAALEAVAFRFAAIDEQIAAHVTDDRSLIATGGALLSSPAWMQIIADALGKELLVSAETEASRRGAALLALESLGVLEDVSQAERTTQSRFLPNSEATKRYRTARQQQQRLYDVLIKDRLLHADPNHN